MRRHDLVCLVLALAWAALAGMAASADAGPPYGLGCSRTPVEWRGRFEAAALLPTGGVPASVDLGSGMPPVGNQGRQGSCVAWATGYYYKTFQENRERGWGVGTPGHQFSPAFIYNQINWGEDGGSYLSDAFALVAKKGCASLTDCPYDQWDFSSWPSESAFRAALPYRAEGYAYLFLQSPGSDDLAQMKAHIANGDPLVLAIPVYNSFYHLQADSVYNGPSWEVRRGGHAIQIVGYDDNKGDGAFRLVNSWGTGWADAGFGWISYGFVMGYAWEAWVMTDRIGYAPSATAHIEIDHTSRGQLRVKVGAGDPTHPDWVTTVYDRQGGTYDNIHTVADVSEGLSYLPPSSTRKWFLRVEDVQTPDVGAIKTFEIEHDADRYPALDVPVAIADLAASVSYIHGFPPGAYVLYDSHTIDDQAFGNDNGRANGGESVTMAVTLSNVGDANAPDVTCDLSTTDPYVTITAASETYGDITSGGSVSRSGFAFEVDVGAPTHAVTFDLDISADGGGYAWTRSFDIVVYEVEPEIVVSPSGISESLYALGDSVTRTLSIGNTGEGSLWFVVGDSVVAALGGGVLSSEPVGSENGGGAPPLGGMRAGAGGGPDGYGYVWKDSDAPGGPTYGWVDISTVGTAVTSWTATSSYDADDEGYAGPFPMGFPFPFYGATYQEAYVGANGYVGFSAAQMGLETFSNQGIPAAAPPECFVAPFWDDFDGGTGSSGSGTVFTYADVANGRFIVQFHSICHYNTSPPKTETFQVILEANGSIVFQYKAVRLGGDCTVGIENTEGTDGLQVAFNEGYLRDNLAVRISKTPPWLSYAPVSDTVFSGTRDVTVKMYALEADTTYRAYLIVSSNDADEPRVQVPVALTVLPDTMPPAPNAIQSVTAQSSSRMDVVSAAAGDHTPPVWYEVEGQFFDGDSLRWLDGGGVSAYAYSTTRPNPWGDTELAENGLYRYRQRVKDSASVPNETSFSPWDSAAALVDAPADSEISFSNVTTGGMDVTVVAPPKPSGAGLTGAYFDLVLGEGEGAGAVDRAYADAYTAQYTDLKANAAYAWEVKLRNWAGVETAPNLNPQQRYTLANVPGAPLLGSPTRTTLSLAMGSDLNPGWTQYAVECTGSDPGDPTWTGRWVATVGDTSGSPVWQVASVWASTPVIGLHPQTAYSFRALARNGEQVETAPGPVAQDTTLANARDAVLVYDGLDAGGKLDEGVGLPSGSVVRAYRSYALSVCDSFTHGGSCLVSVEIVDSTGAVVWSGASGVEVNDRGAGADRQLDDALWSGVFVMRDIANTGRPRGLVPHAPGSDVDTLYAAHGDSVVFKGDLDGNGDSGRAGVAARFPALLPQFERGYARFYITGEYSNTPLIANAYDTLGVDPDFLQIALVDTTVGTSDSVWVYLDLSEVGCAAPDSLFLGTGRLDADGHFRFEPAAEMGEQAIVLSEGVWDAEAPHAFPIVAESVGGGGTDTLRMLTHGSAEPNGTDLVIDVRVPHVSRVRLQGADTLGVRFDARDLAEGTLAPEDFEVVRLLSPSDTVEALSGWWTAPDSTYRLGFAAGTIGTGDSVRVRLDPGGGTGVFDDGGNPLPGFSLVSVDEAPALIVSVWSAFSDTLPANGVMDKGEASLRVRFSEGVRYAPQMPEASSFKSSWLIGPGPAGSADTLSAQTDWQWYEDGAAQGGMNRTDAWGDSLVILPGGKNLETLDADPVALVSLLAGRWADLKGNPMRDTVPEDPLYVHRSRAASQRPIIAVAPAELDFGAYHLGRCDTLALVVRNVGYGPLEIRSISATDPDFEALTTEAVVAAGDSLVLRVRFAPQRVAVYEDTLALDNNDRAKRVPLHGEGTPDRAPVLARIGHRRGYVDSLLSLQLAATDADGDALVYSVANGPAGAALDQDTGAFRWTPAAEQLCTDVQFAVTDGYLSDTETLSLYAGPPQPTPYADGVEFLSDALASGHPRRVVVSGSLAYMANAYGLMIFDITEPSDPDLLGRVPTAGDARGVCVSGSYAYVADSEGLQLIDVNDPAAPQWVGAYAMPSAGPLNVALSGNYAFLAAGDGGLVAVDVRDPISLVRAGRLDTDGSAKALALNGRYAYVADGTKGLVIVDIADPGAPQAEGVCPTFGDASAVAVCDTLVYLADGDNGLVVVSVADPAAPVRVGGLVTGGFACGVSVTGGRVCVADQSEGLVVMNVSDPRSPTRLGSYAPPGQALDVWADSQEACLADGDLGLQVVDVGEPTNPTLLGSYATEGTVGWVAAQGSLVYALDPDYGLRIVDAGDSLNPVRVGECETPGIAYQAVVSGGYAYIADGGNGLQVVDVTNPAAPLRAGRYACSASAHAVALGGRYAYVGTAAGLEIADVADPQNPHLEGLLGLGNAVGVSVWGEYAYMATPLGLEIVRVSDPASPSKVTRFNAPDATGVWARGAYAYVTGRGGLQVVSVSNPSAPAAVGGYATAEAARSVAVHGDYAYVAASEHGITVLDVSDPTQPVLAGYYNTCHTACGVSVVGDRVYVADTYALGVYAFERVEPRIGVSSDSVSFGAVDVGRSVESVVRVTNSGKDTLTAVGSLAMGDVYALAGASGVVVPPGAGADLRIRFAPTQDEAFADTLMISSNDLDREVTRVPLSGSGAPTLGGTVKTYGGVALDGVVVEAWDAYPSGAVAARDTTGGDGAFLLTGLVAQGYDVRGRRPGYYPKITRGVEAPFLHGDFRLEQAAQVPAGSVKSTFASHASLFAGAPLQVGDVVDAYDPQGVHCGTVAVDTVGRYRAAVWADSPGTPQDEGAETGDTLGFRINDYEAILLGGDPVWEAGLVKMADLSTTYRDRDKITFLHEGWNLFSFTVRSESTTVAGILHSIEGHYSVVMGAESTYVPGSPYVGLTTLQVGEGYWVKMIQPDQMSITGSAVPIDTALTLKDGWNLVGYMPEEEMTVSTALASLAGDLRVVLGEQGTYVSDEPLFSTLSTMQDSRGYWIRVAGSHTFAYPAPGSAGAAKPTGKQTEPPAVAVTPTWVEFCGDALLDGRQVGPGDVVSVCDPDGVLCGRFVVRHPGQYGYLRVYGDDTFTARDEGAQPGDELVFSINGVEAATERSATWTTDKSITKLGLHAKSAEAGVAPRIYGLAQNFPNPFNPSTVIAYQLPVETRVVIRVHDALGQVVSTLVRQIEAAGPHRVVWHGRDQAGHEVASGVYFCSMEAGGQVRVRKMLLIR